MNKSSVNRQIDLDWIRVIATLIVFLYHISMFFNPFAWHIKNNVINQSYILAFTLFVGTWIMPIFFAISGITTFHTLQSRSGKEFLHERFVRLGIPLVFGVFVLTPPQVYIERVTHKQFEGTFVEFFPHYFNGLYLEINGTGNFAFVGLHLWYVFVLLIFSLLLLPILLKVKVSTNFNYLHYVFIPCLLLVVAVFVEIVNLGGWGIPYYLFIYFMGFIFFSQKSFKDFIQKNSFLLGAIALISSIIYLFGMMNELSGKSTLVSLFFNYIKVLNCWNWLLFIFYLGDKYLSKPKKGLKYLIQASMPFYVLHQPIIVGIAFFLYPLSWNTPNKLLFLTLVSLVVIMVIYHFVIQHFSLFRVVFGLKGKSKKAINKTFISTIQK